LVQKFYSYGDYSDVTVHLFLDFVDAAFFDTEIFKTLAEISELCGRELTSTYTKFKGSKFSRLLKVIQIELEGADKSCWDNFMATFLRKRKRFLEYLDRRLLSRLNEEGFPWETLSDEEEIVEGVSIPAKVYELKRMLVENEFDITLHHLQEALSSIELGNYSAANSQIRTMFEAFFEELMHRRFGSDCEGGDCRREFAERFLSEEENNLLKSFVQVLHSNGAHPGKGEKQESEFRLLSAIAWMIYAATLAGL